ncbi:conserved hypothetical protein [Thiomonas delicata]|uniref:DUF4440 domain-containing protein n=2 Tax=Thiomonas delicata TaxID=364030 RepID=A0A238D308_THIDL|nr:conserved hypothetical protein [Thiomonas delicata]
MGGRKAAEPCQRGSYRSGCERPRRQNLTQGISSMLESIEHQIDAVEEELRLAMLASDVESLDALISPSLIFTTHFGSSISKQDDLEIHRSGALKFQAIEPSERKVLILNGLGYVSVRMRLSGAFSGSPFQEDVRFSRVWQRSQKNSWQVVAGQATVVQPK